MEEYLNGGGMDMNHFETSPELPFHTGSRWNWKWFAESQPERRN
jgi:hypothetical protein